MFCLIPTTLDSSADQAADYMKGRGRVERSVGGTVRRKLQSGECNRRPDPSGRSAVSGLLAELVWAQSGSYFSVDSPSHRE